MIERTTYRIPAVAETANLIRVNYCPGCDRFTKTSEYGTCKRADGQDKEIPKDATVSQCWYTIEKVNKTIARNRHGRV